MAPTSRCAHTLPSQKKIKRIQNLIDFIRTASPAQLNGKVAEVWASPECSITDPRILLTIGASPTLLFEDSYGEKTLHDRLNSGSICDLCGPKYQAFLDTAQVIYDAQFHAKPVIINNKCLAETQATNNTNMIALSCDGGGMRGLVSIVCLLFVSRRIFGNESLAQKVDWLVGCSTGSILALAIAKGYTLTETFFLYWEMKNEIFIDKSTVARLFGNVIDKQTDRMNAVLQRCFPDENDTFQNYPKRLTVPALNASCTPAKLHTFRNYSIGIPSQDATNEDISFRDAARASSAAPTYFHPHHIGNDVFVDGSLVANCPLTILFKEFDKSTRANKNISLGCVISIGTGEPMQTKRRYKSGKSIQKKSKYLRDMALLLVEQSVGHEKSAIECTADRCAASSIPFFRLSPYGIDVRIDQIDDGKLMDMIWETLLYLVESVNVIDDLGQTLKIVVDQQQHSNEETRSRAHTVN